jgi:hypothetical protein
MLGGNFSKYFHFPAAWRRFAVFPGCFHFGDYVPFLPEMHLHGGADAKTARPGGRAVYGLLLF